MHLFTNHKHITAYFWQKVRNRSVFNQKKHNGNRCRAAGFMSVRACVYGRKKARDYRDNPLQVAHRRIELLFQE